VIDHSLANRQKTKTDDKEGQFVVINDALFEEIYSSDFMACKLLRDVDDVAGKPGKGVLMLQKKSKLRRAYKPRTKHDLAMEPPSKKRTRKEEKKGEVPMQIDSVGTFKVVDPKITYQKTPTKKQ